MADLLPADFTEFFRGVHEHEPFPWQRMLLERIAAGADWPQVIDLPTASGKTACIDIAVFALALQAEVFPPQRTARRRIFFVVDRRIVVDEAFERAARLAAKLDAAKSGILKAVAERLRSVSDGTTPLAVARLRGGIARTRQLWSENPLQPAVITSTVDQIGSRLLFRSYGGSPLIAPVHAAMAAYDSLIILDEAHCAQPFMQTVSSVRNYLDRDKWSYGKVTVAPPLKIVVMSATAPLADAAGKALDKFPTAQERSAALDDPKIIERFTAVKSARLESTENGGISALIKRASALAREAISSGCKRIAVMVNRVSLASEIATAIKDLQGLPPCEIVLLTGRMRPIDRDELVNQLSKSLRAVKPVEPSQPIVVVTTQCLEVGADFSFDFLVTQCASVDALIQRFGRLDRLGLVGKTSAVILANKQDIADTANDPIYGKAIAETWKWLLAQAKDSAEPRTVNFGISAIGEMVRSLNHDTLNLMLAPHPDAPILMPSHVDILCQTAPHPVPDIDVPAYLHGVGRGQPEVRVAFRVDIADAGGKLRADNEAVAAYCQLCPVGKQECLSVPISRLRDYLLGGRGSSDGDEDVEGAAVEDESRTAPDPGAGKQFLRCRGGEWKLINAPGSRDLIRPNDLVVLPMLANDEIPDELGTRLKEAAVDRAEEAAWVARPRENTGGTSGIFLRVNKTVLQQRPLVDAARPLLEWLDKVGVDKEADSPDIESLRAALAAVPDGGTEGEESTLKRFAKVCKAVELAIRPKYIRPHPIATRSWIIAIPGTAIDVDDLASGEDATSDSGSAVLLASHLKDVGAAARKFAHGLPAALQDALKRAGQWHDLGKLDPRFQELLGNIDTQPLAKSETRSARKPDFRHEMISLQIVQNCLADKFPADAVLRELLLHVIAAHHGHARPFAPAREDAAPEDILSPANFDPPVKLTTESRDKLPKPHHLGSGIPDRFWLLTRHFGWWGLAYCESVLRLADWEASANPTAASIVPEEAPEEVVS